MNQTAVAKVGQEPLPTTDITPMAMLRMAVERGSDLDQLQKLMDLQERWEATEARKACTVAMAAYTSEAPALTKNRRGGYESTRTGGVTDYEHATLDHIAETLGPVLSRHGLSYDWETDQPDGGQIRVTCALTHVLGHCKRVTLQAGPDQSGSKNSIQAIGSTVTYLERYTLLAVTGMATKGQDDDGNTANSVADLISEEQQATLEGLINETNADTNKFLQAFGISSIDLLPADRFGEAELKLEQRKAALARKAQGGS